MSHLRGQAVYCFSRRSGASGKSFTLLKKRFQIAVRPEYSRCMILQTHDVLRWFAMFCGDEISPNDQFSPHDQFLSASACRVSLQKMRTSILASKEYGFPSSWWHNIMSYYFMDFDNPQYWKDNILHYISLVNYICIIHVILFHERMILYP